MQPLTKELANYFGLEKSTGILISAVADNSPAQKAGIRRGDIILEFNKIKINDPKQLSEEVAKRKIGEKVNILIYRDNKFLSIPVIIEAR